MTTPDLTDALFCVVQPPLDAPVFAKFVLSARETVDEVELWLGDFKETELQKFSTAAIAPRTEYWRTPPTTYAWIPSTEYVLKATVFSDRFPVFQKTAGDALVDEPVAPAKSVLPVVGGSIEGLDFGLDAGNNKIVTATIHTPAGFGANPVHMKLWKDSLAAPPPTYTVTTATFSFTQNLPNDRKLYTATYDWTEGIDYQFRAMVRETIPLTWTETSYSSFGTSDTMPTA